MPRFAPQNLKANQAIVDMVRHIAERNRVTPAQIALAWVLAQKPWIVPIPGTTKVERLEENLGSVDVALAPEELQEIEQLSATITIHGHRYSEGSQRMIDR